jgi:hypothetical protein
MFKLFKPKAFAYVEEYRLHDGEEYKLSETRFVIEPGLVIRLAGGGNFVADDCDALYKKYIELLAKKSINAIGSRVPFPRRTDYRKGNMWMKRIPLEKYKELESLE